MARPKKSEHSLVDTVLKEVFAELSRQNVNITIDGMMQMAAAVKAKVNVPVNKEKPKQ